MKKALSAVAFTIVLAFVGVAAYLVISNIRTDLPRITIVQPGDDSTPTVVAAAETAASQPEAVPTDTSLPPATATAVPTTPAPSATHTAVAPTATSSPAPPAASTIQVVTPTNSPTLTPKAGTATATIETTTTPTADLITTPTGAATATAQPAAGNYAFYLDGNVIHDIESSCVAQYIRGMVHNKAGDPMESVRIKAFDLWGNEVMSISKGGPDIGKWDIVLGGTENIWKVVVVDGGGAEISPIAEVPHHQEDEFKSACVHIVNWRRSW